MYINKKRFTILELIVSMSVLVVMMTIMMRFFSDAQKAWGASSGQAEIYDNARIAMDLITSDINAISYGESRDVHFKGNNEFIGFFSYLNNNLKKVRYRLCTTSGNKFQFLTRSTETKESDFTDTDPNTVFKDNDDNTFKRIIPHVVSLKFTYYDKNLQEISIVNNDDFPWYIKVDIGLLGSNNFAKWAAFQKTSKKDAIDPYIIPISKLIYLGYRGQTK